ncbi:MAG: copper ion binding protein [Firmicutes bacterium]|nr:copper ion binding protein [Bacillota bacterium]
MNSVEFKVNDMTCSNCVDVVRSAVGALKGVENVKIDPDSKHVKVDFDDAAIHEQDIKSAVTDMGYNIH